MQRLRPVLRLNVANVMDCLEGIELWTNLLFFDVSPCSPHVSASFLHAHGDWSFHMLPLLSSFFGSRTRDGRMLYSLFVCFVMFSCVERSD